MSAESSEGKPSFDDILSSIRQMIAEDATDDAAEAGNLADSEPRAGVNGAHPHPANGSLRAPDTADDLVEDVLDLSEEYIVTEAAAAVRREQERLRREAAEAQDAGARDADTEHASAEDLDDHAAVASSESAADDDEPDEPARGDMSAAELWSGDFQMPVSDSGPASPFTTAREAPASSWPSSDPLDPTELYSQARSSSPADRPLKAPRVHAHALEDQGDIPAEPQPADDTAAAEMPADGIELASFTETADDDAPDLDSVEDQPPHDTVTRTVAGPDDAPIESAAPRLSAAEEIEAAFGMPARTWVPPVRLAPSREGFSAPARTADGEPDGPMAHDLRDHEEDNVEPDGSGNEPMSDHEGAYADHPAAASEQARPLLEATRGPAAMPASHFAAKTLEDSVKELLRPMLAEWLDRNMPRLVEAAMRDHMEAPDGGEHAEPETGNQDRAATHRRFGTDH